MAWNNQGWGNRGGGGNRGGDAEKKDYPNSGALFSNDKKSPKSPDFTGNLSISNEVLLYVLDQAKAGAGSVTLDIAGWRKQSQSGYDLVSLTVNLPYAERKAREEQQSPQRQRWQPSSSGRPDRDERAQYGSAPQRQYQPRPNPARGGYGETTGYDRGGRRGPAPMSDEQFKAGDQMPDFMRDDDDGNPPF